jgi:hypothetical protein
MWAPKMLRMSGCNRAMNVHVLGEHVHCSNHYGIVIIWGCVVTIADISEGITPCMFVGLECVDYWRTALLY